MSDYANRYRTSTSTLHYDATSQWTRSYIQVWDASRESWSYASCAEYVDMHSELRGDIFDVNQNDYIEVDDVQVSKRVYSRNYSNYDQRMIDAVIGTDMHKIMYDKVGDITYKHGNTTVACHRGNFA